MRFRLLLAAALVLRVLVACTHGFAGDRDVFEGWAQTLATYGPLAIYGPLAMPAVDYSPGYLYVLWATGVAHAAIGGGAVLWRVLLEIVPIGGDLALITLLYRFARGAYGETRALWLAAALSFSPPLWLDSATWGQADSVPIALAIVAMLAALDDRFAPSWPVLALALVIKPLVVVVAPILAVLDSFSILRARVALRASALGIAASLALAYILTLPFTRERSPLAVLRFLLDRYVTGAGKAPYVTGGGFTIYPLFTPFYTLDSARFGPLTYHTWGVLLVLLCTSAATGLLARALVVDPDRTKRTARVFGAASISLLGLFLFATRMHERYLLPAIVVGSPLALEDRATALALGWLATSFTVNCLYSLNNFTGGAHHPVTVTVGRAICAFNVIAFAVLWQRQLRRLAYT